MYAKCDAIGHRATSCVFVTLFSDPRFSLENDGFHWRRQSGASGNRIHAGHPAVLVRFRSSKRFSFFLIYTLPHPCFLSHFPPLADMTRFFKLLACATIATQARAAGTVTYGPSTFTVPGPFPTSLYDSYYNNPTATSAQPQPVISDPVLVRIHAIS